MPWKPARPGERPTLGYYALDWIITNLAAPDREFYVPFVPSREQGEFLLGFYELDPVTGRRFVRRGVLSRSRGWGKSPFLSAVAILEGLGDVVPDGWDEDGQPVGRPWASVRTPLVQIAAASESQTNNAWEPLLEMLQGDAPVLGNYPGLEPLGSFVNLPWGRIEPVTASVTSVKGKRPVFTLADQTEQWVPGNGGVKLAEVLLNNATKIGGTLIESPNAYTPGMGSVAENTAKAYLDQLEGRTKMDRGLLYDHREAPADTDLADLESLTAGLRYAYGDSSDHLDGCVLHSPPCRPGWSPIDNIVARIWDTDADEQSSRGDWLNQITNASDAYLTQPEWKACFDLDRVIADGDTITLGFDGSRGRAKGKPDATALIGCRVSDGHLFELFVDEATSPSSWPSWEPDIVKLEDAIRTAFARYRVVGFYADPARDWRSHVDSWEATYGSQTVLAVTVGHPFEWWFSGGRSTLVERAVELFEGAVRNHDLSHAGEFRLTEHVLNARRRIVHSKLTLGKASDYSDRKIDACTAAVLAYQARVDAVAKGEPRVRKTAVIIRAR